jgi:hypothetical protein
MIAGLLHNTGIFGGSATSIFHRRKHARMEHLLIRQNVVRHWLSVLQIQDLECRFDWPNVSHVMKVARDYPLYRDDQRIDSYLEQEGYEGGPWFYKDNRLLWLYETFKCLYPHATWVVVRRDPLELVESCLKTWWMQGRHGHTAWLEWATAGEAQLQKILQREHGDALEVFPTEMLQSNATAKQTYEQLCQRANVAFNQLALDSFMSGRWWGMEARNRCIVMTRQRGIHK